MMILLTDKIWKTLKGGYNIPYDVSIPLARLESSHSFNEQDEILDELFNELHHQGDVGLASYLAVPQLIRIGIEKGISNWRILALIAIIEIERHSEQNPVLPKEYESNYIKMLDKVSELTILNYGWDRTFTSSALSAIAASKGQIAMATVILNFDDEDLTGRVNEFLKSN